MPEGTVNAISLIVNCLLKSGVCTPQEEAYLNVLHTLHADTDGSALGIAADDGLFDPLTIIGGTIEMADGVIRQSFDCRYPTNTDPEKMTAAIRKVCGSAATLENVSSRVPFYIDADSPAIQTLINNLQRRHRRGQEALYNGRRHLCTPLPLCRQLRPRAHRH